MALDDEPTDGTSSPSSSSDGPVDEQQGWLTTRRRITIAVCGLVIVAIAIGALGQVVKTQTTSDLTFPGAITSVEISNKSGKVDLVDGLTKPIAVQRKTEYVLGKPAVSERVEGGVLKITAECKGLHLGGCSADYRIDVPVNVTVKVVGTGGTISANGIKADLDISTDAGDVDAVSTYGRLAVRTEAGDVDIDKSSSAEVTVKTGVGSAKLVFAVAPSNVDATSGAGDVNVSLPKGDTAYALDAASQSGKTTSQVKRDDTSPYKIKARSDAGDVSVTTR